MSSPSSLATMPSHPIDLQPLRRASSDPVYSSTHLHATPSSPSRSAAFFHHSSLQARSYSSPAIRPPPIESRVRSHRRQTHAPHRPSFEPLWEDTHTFSDAQLVEFQGRAVAINAKLARLKRVLGGEVFGRHGEGGGAFRVSELLALLLRLLLLRHLGVVFVLLCVTLCSPEGWFVVFVL